MIPFVNYKRCYKEHKKEIDNAIKSCLKNGDLILREDVGLFEKGLAKFVGQKYSVGLNSGTDALFLALKALGIGKGDEVITVSHTFIATIAAIHNVGATPVLVDIGDDMLMDIEQVKKSITEKTKCIIAVHLNGNTVDIKRLKEICRIRVKRFKLEDLPNYKTNIVSYINSEEIPIIEDSAQAIGITTTDNGVIKCFSFYPAKMLGCYGDGGAITTDDKEISDKIKVWRDNAQKRLSSGEKIEDNLMVDYGYNSRLDNIQAAILNIKLKYLRGWLVRRKEIVRTYNKGFGLDWDTPQNYIYLSNNREELARYLKKQGIETLIRDQIPNHKHSALGLDCSLPKTEELAKKAIALPLYPELTNKEVNYIIKKVKLYAKKIGT
jgi:dTDP-4-amino-4,6-dideoxygalactose transaminase